MKRRRQLDEEADDVGQDKPTPKRKTRVGRTLGKGAQIDDDSGSDANQGPWASESSVKSVALNEDAEDNAGIETTSDSGDLGNPIRGTRRGILQSTPQKPLENSDPKGNGTHLNGLVSKKLFSTPTTKDKSTKNNTPRIERNANRSARRKSTRSLIERTIRGYTSDNDEEEGDLADQIYGSEDDEVPEEFNDEGNLLEDTIAPDTPSKRRGRPKGSKNRIRSASPVAHDLPPHEKYFAQNRPGRAKTSNNTLANFKLLDHEEYFAISRKMKDSHAESIDEIASLHAKSFNQWQFELNQNFNLCVYGWGSKRSLLLKFAEYIYLSQPDHSRTKIVIVNGYVQSLTIRDVFHTVASAISEPGFKLGSQPAEMLERLFALMEENKNREITLIIHSIDRTPLRRPATQTLLARLSAHPQIRLVASADHPSFPLLWDSSLRSTFNFLFHECATFQPYTAEFDVVDEVHELLGRSGRRVGGKDGVIFVLKSLPVNATNLFKILIGEQLAGMEDNAHAEPDYDNDNDDDERIGRGKKAEEGVEYRTLYQKAVEEFICSNDMGFRSLLKEFHDHQMIQKKKDMLGTEYLFVPFRKEELESILEDISG